MSNVLQLGMKPFLVVFILALLGWLLFPLEPVLMPFVMAALLAYLVAPVADRLEARGFSRTLSVVVCFIVITLVLLGV